MIQSKVRAEAGFSGFDRSRGKFIFSFLKLHFWLLIILFFGGMSLNKGPFYSFLCYKMFFPPLQKDLVYFSISKLIGQRQMNRVLAGLFYFCLPSILFSGSFKRILVLVLVLVLVNKNDDDDENTGAQQPYSTMFLV